MLGGGTAGWMTAAALSHKFKGLPVSIQLVESDEIGTVGVGEATLPHIRNFNNTLNISEPALMKATEATIKLGIEFCDWGRIGDRYIHPFGDFGPNVNGVPVLSILAAHCASSVTPRASTNIRSGIMLAEMGRFTSPAPIPRASNRRSATPISSMRRATRASCASIRKPTAWSAPRGRSSRRN